MLYVFPLFMHPQLCWLIREAELDNICVADLTALEELFAEHVGYTIICRL